MPTGRLRATQRILAHREKRIERVEPQRAIYKDGTVIDFDWMISFPPYAAHTRFDSMPTDDRGFIHADPDTWRVRIGKSA